MKEKNQFVNCIWERWSNIRTIIVILLFFELVSEIKVILVSVVGLI